MPSFAQPRQEARWFVNQTERLMYRMIPYRGFEIHVELRSSSEDLYDVSFVIKGVQNLAFIGDRGRIPLRNGPFTRRWAYLIAEVAGQAAIDVLLGAPADDHATT